MDLWDVATNFLVVNVTGKHFKVTEILNLASSLKLQLKPPRNANSAQISFFPLLHCHREKYCEFQNQSIIDVEQTHESAREKARMESRHMDLLSMIRIMRGRVMGVGETTQD